LTNSTICIDASVLLKLVVDEEASDLANDLWARWVAEGTEIVAPPLIYYETTSSLRNKVYRGLLPADQAAIALEEAFNLRVALVEPMDMHLNAWQLATRFNRPVTYDATYLAIAEAFDCPLWTADRRLFNAVKEQFPAINLVGESSA
jgi:predicted nucleic acid-binding protein